MIERRWWAWLRPWLMPWREVALLRADVKRQAGAISLHLGRIRRLNDDLENAQASSAQFFSDNRELVRRNQELQRQLANTTAPKGSGRALIGYDQAGGAKPEFVIVGLDRGAAGGKRIYASRDLGAPSFGADPDTADATMKLITFMGRMLTIDKPSYGEALNRMAEIWANWDRDDQPALPQRLRAIDAGWNSGSMGTDEV